MREFFYSVEGPALYGDSMETAHWGVSAEISMPFANALINQKRTEKIEQIIEGDAKLILQRGKFPGFALFKRDKNYRFFEDTCLLHAVEVPGDACDLALDESALNEISRFRDKGEIEYNLGYMQHNVDSFAQAVFLEVLFRSWAIVKDINNLPNCMSFP